MPRCKYCHSEISKFDTDICPSCGEKNPIDADYRTIDITQHIDPQTGDFKLYKSKKKSVCVALAALFGPFGADSFYLGYIAKGWISCFMTFLVVGVASTILFLLEVAGPWIYFLSYGLLWFIHLLRALVLARTDSLKDARGEFLR